MITEALIFGSLETAVYRDDSGLKAITIDNGETMDCSRDLSLLLCCTAEKRYLNPVPESLEQLKEQLQFWGQRHYLLKLLVSGMDKVCGDNTRQACIKAAESLSQQSELAEFAKARLLGCVLAESADLSQALVLSEQYPFCCALYQQLDHVKSIIPTVLSEFQILLINKFPATANKESDTVLRLAVDSGLIEKVVIAVDQQDKQLFDQLILDYSRHSVLTTCIPRLTHLLTTLRGQLSQSFVLAKPEALSCTFKEDQEEFNDEIGEVISTWEKKTKRNKKLRKQNISPEKALESIDKQKTFILKLCQQNKLAEAEQAIIDLAHFQKQGNANAGLRHLCKSFCDLGSSIAKLGHYDFVLKLYTYAQQSNAADAVAYTGYAETLRSQGRLDDALAAYQQTKLDFPEDEFACNGYAETLRSLGRLDDALAAYQQIKQSFLENVVACNGYAETLRSLGRLDDALVAYQQIKKDFPKDVVACAGYAETLRSQGRFDDALVAYQQTILDFPNNIVVYCGYAETLRSLGQLDDALAAYQQTKQKFPKDIVACSGYAETLRSLGRLDDALVAYQQIKKDFPKDVVACAGYAETLRSLGRLDDALAAYQQTKQNFPENVIACNGYAETLRSLGRLDDALAAYQQTKQNFPEDVVACNGYAETLRSLGRLDDALVAYQQTKKYFPKDEFACNGYAETLRTLGRLDDAKTEYERTIQQFQNNIVSKNSLACLFIELRAYSQARNLLNIKDSPQSFDDWRAYHVISMSYLHENKLEQAQKMLIYGVNQAPSSSQAFFKTALGFLYLKQKQASKALEFLQITENNIVTFPKQAILYAHALAVTDNKQQAKTILDQIPRQNTEIIRFCDVFRERYLTDELIEATRLHDLDQQIEIYELALSLRVV